MRTKCGDIWNPTFQTSFSQLHINKSINQPGKKMHRSKVGKKNIVKAKTACGWLSKNTLPIMPSYYRLIGFTMGLDSF